MEDVLLNSNENLVASIPDERVKQERNEINNLLISRPVIKDTLDWFEVQIASTSNIDSIDLSSYTDDTSLRAQLMAQRIVKSMLESKRNELVARINALDELEKINVNK